MVVKEKFHQKTLACKKYDSDLQFCKGSIKTFCISTLAQTAKRAYALETQGRGRVGGREFPYVDLLQNTIFLRIVSTGNEEVKKQTLKIIANAKVDRRFATIYCCNI